MALSYKTKTMKTKPEIRADSMVKSWGKESAMIIQFTNIEKLKEYNINSEYENKIYEEIKKLPYE